MEEVKETDLRINSAKKAFMGFQVKDFVVSEAILREIRSWGDDDDEDTYIEEIRVVQVCCHRWKTLLIRLRKLMLFLRLT